MVQKIGTGSTASIRLEAKSPAKGGDLCQGNVMEVRGKGQTGKIFGRKNGQDSVTD